MKAVTLALAVVAALATVTYGAPAGGSQLTPKWVNSNDRMNNLRDIIKNAANAIKFKQVSLSDAEIDWARVEVLGAEYKTVFTSATEAIVKIGLETNSPAGQQIADIALTFGNKIDSILTGMIKDIKDRTLDSEGVQEYYAQSQIWFQASNLQIERYHRDLSEDVVKQIKNVYNKANNTYIKIYIELIQMFENKAV